MFIILKYDNLFFVLPTVSTVENRVRNIVKEYSSDVLIINTQQERYQASRLAKFAIAASGTVALELAIINVPHLVCYRVPRLTAWVAKHFTNIKYINLTNILLNKPIVPELLQEDCNKETISNIVDDLLNEQSLLYKKEQTGFADLRQNLGFGVLNPSKNAANIILDIIKDIK